MPGPARTPTARLKLTGSNKAKYERQDEPDPVDVSFRAPKYLNKPAREEWDRVVPDLKRMGILSNTDMTILISYCQSWGQYLELQKDIDRDGFVIEVNGNPKKNPAAACMEEAWKRFIRSGQELGLTPAARTKVAGTKSKKGSVSDLRELLK